MMGDFSNMGNKSLSYLEGNDIPINCSVYSLTSGMLRLQLFGQDNTTWTNASHDFLPAYYITNCSIPHLITLVTESNIESDGSNSEYNRSPYNQKDNGDTFVALLFIICGSCVSCWMLSLLLYLSPKHKRKPLLAQLATVFYSVVTTILLNRLTQIAKEEYYEDMLDIIRLYSFIYDYTVYKVMVVLSRLFTAIAWFQIALKISRQKYKWLTMTIGGVLITAHIVAQIYYQIVFDNSAAIFSDNLVGAFQHWKIARACLQLVILIWFAANILCYTTVIKSPRKVCYSRRLLPLAIFNWCIIVLNATLTILYVSLFRYNWLVKTWLGLLPYLLDVILITTVWEWIYKIWVLEKRFELMGVLGRKMSADEGMSINSDDIGRNKMVLQSKNKVLSMLNGILHIGNNKIVEDVGSVKSIELEDLSTKDSSMPSDQTPQSNEHSHHQHQHLHHRVNFFVDDETPGTSPSNANVSPNTNPDGSDADYDDEIVDNYEIWGREEDDTDDIGNHETGDDSHEVIIGSSNQFESGSNDSTEPPPFQPLPGFSEEDYWNDEKR